MSDTNEPGDEKGGEVKKTLSLKRGGNTVRQSFSHGRSNTVVVEKKRRRFSAPGSAPASEAAPAAAEARPAAAPKPAPAATKPVVETKPAPSAPQPPQNTGNTGSTILRQLSNDEQEARAKALAFAREREEERKEQDVAAEQERQERADAERLAAEKRKEEEAREKAEEEARLAEEQARAEEEASKAAMIAEANPAAPATKRAPEERGGGRKDSDDAKGGLKAYERPKAAEPKPTRRTNERRRGKLTLSNALDDSERERSLASIKRQREREKARAAAKAPREKIVREVVIPETCLLYTSPSPRDS